MESSSLADFGPATIRTLKIHLEIVLDIRNRISKLRGETFSTVGVRQLLLSLFLKNKKPNNPLNEGSSNSIKEEL